MQALRIIVLDGDETGQELLEEAVRVLDPSVSRVDPTLVHYDLSLANRRRPPTTWYQGRAAIRTRASASRRPRSRRRARTTWASPNRILREGIGGRVIIRTGRRIPGVTPVAGVHHPIAVVRMAVGDAYGAEQGREDVDGDEVAWRTERISRNVCTAVAEYSFRTAERIGGEVYGGPKWTVSPIYEGMLKEEMDAAAARPSRRALQPRPDRRHLRRADRRSARPPAGDPGSQSRRGLPVGLRAAHVRLDRGGRVGPARARRRLRAHGGDGRGAARHGPRAARARTSPIRWR